MKLYILTLAMGLTSFGTFAQIGDLKNAAKDVDVEAAKTVVTDKANEVTTEQVDQLKENVADKVNVDVEKINDAAKLATDAVENGTIDNLKAEAGEKVAEIKSEKMAEIDVDALSVDELKTVAAEKEVLKDEKKANLLTKITDLTSKITAAESKLALLKESGASLETLTSKAGIIEGAKTQLAALTASYL